MTSVAPARCSSQLGLDDDRNNHGLATMLGVDPPPHCSAHHLRKGVRVPGAVGSSIFQRFHQCGAHIVKDRIIRGETTSVDFWPDNNPPGLGVNGEEDGDESFFGECAPIFQIGFRDFAHRRSIDKDKPNIELAGNGRNTGVHINDGAVFPHQSVLGRTPDSIAMEAFARRWRASP